MKPILALLAIALPLAACERESRDFRADPNAETQERIVQSSLSPGLAPPVEILSGHGKKFEENAYDQSEGKRLFSAFNCAGCHSQGGGGMGPPLMDQKWIYGAKIENIVQTIREGRPNGMPSFRGKVPDNQIWQLAAYVRSMGRNVRQDVAPSRSDDMHPHPSENRQPPQNPVPGGIASPSATAPQ
jgi:cytochrome c oxidase cbb3-type subunit III